MGFRWYLKNWTLCKRCRERERERDREALGRRIKEREKALEGPGEFVMEIRAPGSIAIKTNNSKFTFPSLVGS
jgi:hypothetical protein